MKIILLNGPPRSGKDTIATKLHHLLCDDGENVTTVKFAAPLKAAATAIYCNGNVRTFGKYDSSEFKDTPQDVFLGKTCREVQMALSEGFLKPFHSEAVFGEILAREIERQLNHPLRPKDIFIVSDSGFRPEAEVLVQKFGAENILLVRLSRLGYTYKGDTRGYIDLSDLGVKAINIENREDSVDIAVNNILSFID